MFDEEPINLEAFPPPSGYIVLQSEIFTEDSIAKAMQEALSLAESAGLQMILRKVADYLFRFLEARREFVLLSELYDIVMAAYERLSVSEKSNVCFSRVFVGTAGQPVSQFKEAIRISTIEQKKYIPSFESAGIRLLEKQRDPLTAHEDAVMQIMKVHCDPAAFLALKASRFQKDIIVAPNCNWNETYVVRYIYETVRPLPSFASFVDIKSTKTESITREAYFVEQLTHFQNTFKRMVDSLVAVFPSEKMKRQWGQCPLGVSTRPILDLLVTVTRGDTDHGRAPHFALVLSRRKGELVDSVPPKLAELADAIWKQLSDSVQIVGETQSINKAEAADVEKLNLVKGVLATSAGSSAASADVVPASP